CHRAGKRCLAHATLAGEEPVAGGVIEDAGQWNRALRHWISLTYTMRTRLTWLKPTTCTRRASFGESAFRPEGGVSGLRLLPLRALPGLHHPTTRRHREPRAPAWRDDEGGRIEQTDAAERVGQRATTSAAVPVASA